MREEKATEPKVIASPWGETPDGQACLYTLVSGDGFTAEISNYGGTIARLAVPDRAGIYEDVVLGFKSLQEYISNSAYLGCIIGRFGNRIGGGRFSLDGETYELARNNEPNGIPCHLHGGPKGFDKQFWEARPVFRNGMAGLELWRLSLDGEEGYPGNLSVTVTYWITINNELIIEYYAETDAPTIVNLTNHSYFNLKGEGEGTILDHELTLYADRFTVADKGLIPTGELKHVAGTPMDFTEPHQIGARIDADDEQLRFGGGYDQNWVLSGEPDSDGLRLAATVHEPASGRVMEVLTSEPGVQFYSGNFLEGNLPGKSGKIYQRRGGFCLETQHFPDSPNKPEFPSVVLRPGERYESVTVYRFGAE